jgi:hypothetical protein
MNAVYSLTLFKIHFNIILLGPKCYMPFKFSGYNLALISHLIYVTIITHFNIINSNINNVSHARVTTGSGLVIGFTGLLDSAWLRFTNRCRTQTSVVSHVFTAIAW